MQFFPCDDTPAKRLSQGSGLSTCHAPHSRTLALRVRPRLRAEASGSLTSGRKNPARRGLTQKGSTVVFLRAFGRQEARAVQECESQCKPDRLRRGPRR